VKLAQPLWLASRSPRRKLMLEEAGLEVRVQPPDFDDARLRPGRVSLYEWVTALAALKAWRVADLVRGAGDRVALWFDGWSSCGMSGTVIGADTMCVKGSEALGQPRHADDARRMLHLLRNTDHETITGVCAIDLARGARFMFCDRAIVRVGDLTDSQIDQYVSSGEWRGKAGAYNLAERIHAGWPIECLGDPATVMGLPMRRLRRFTIDD
jgi:septum formation protein